MVKYSQYINNSNISPVSENNTKSIDDATKSFFIPRATSLRLEMTLKQKVRMLLLRKGISQNKLADIIGISSGTISKIVNEEWLPTASLKIRISKELECDSLILFGDSKYWSEYSDKIKYLDKENKR